MQSRLKMEISKVSKEFLKDNQQEMPPRSGKEKIALVEITPYHIKLTLAWYAPNSFEVFDEYIEPVMLFEEIERDGLIKPTQVAICKETVRMYRKLCDALKITRSIAFATYSMRAAKNHYGFLDELKLSSGFKFKLLTEEEEISEMHTAVVNSLDISRGVILSVEEDQTRIIGYVRRTVLGNITIPFGFETLRKLFMEGDSNFEEQCAVIKEFFTKQIKPQPWMQELDLSELQFIGLGPIFGAAGKISRKGKKYPLEMAHNYPMSKSDFENVYNAVNSLKMDKDARIKGVSHMGAGSIASGFAIISAIVDALDVREFTLGNVGVDTGVLFNHCVPMTNEKPLQDLLGYSLETNQRFYQSEQSNGAHVFDLAMLLFKQLRVMHRLPRPYVRPLKIACYMYNSGSRLRFQPSGKDALPVIVNTQLYGASHKDLVLAAFIASSQHNEELSLSDWVRYKDLTTDDDLQAVKSLAVLVRIATAFDCAKQRNITDIICDVLGDSVIMKTITEDDIAFELKLAQDAGADFKKVFGKTLELL